MSQDIKRMTTDEISEFLSLEEERRRLNRLAADLEKKAKPIKEKILQFVRTTGGKSRSVVSCGHVLAIITRAGTVTWKDEFIRVAGEDEAEKLRSAVPPTEMLSVEKVAA